MKAARLWLLLPWMALFLNGCGAAGETTARADLAQARLDGDYDVTYVLSDLGHAHANSFNDFGTVGDTYRLVWRARADCVSGLCPAQDLGPWDPDQGSVDAAEAVNVVSGKYRTTTEFADPEWQCLPGARTKAWTGEKLLDITPTRAVHRGGQLVISRFTASRTLTFTASQAAIASGCSSFTVRWQLVGTLYDWR